MGADVLLYPITIGSEPQDASIHSQGHWRRTMQGLAAANMAVVAASNQIGMERMGEEITFYRGSFIADETSGLVSEIGEGQEIYLAKFDLEEIANRRAALGKPPGSPPTRVSAIVFSFLLSPLETASVSHKVHNARGNKWSLVAKVR